MGHDKISNLFGAVLAGTCFFVSLSTVLLFGPSSAYALPISLGPFADTAPFTDINRMGPNGAQINIIKHPDTFGLTGRLPNGERIRIGQIEFGEPLAAHIMFGGRVTRRGVGLGDADSVDHATAVAGILIGGTFTPPSPPAPPGTPTITGIASQAALFSTGMGINAAQFLGVPPPPPPAGAQRRGLNFLTDKNVNVINMSAGFLDGANNFRVGENGGGVEALIVDRTVRENDIVFVKSAGNCGAPIPDHRCRSVGMSSITVPGDAFNAITVGATGQDAAGLLQRDYTRVANYSSRGPTSAGQRHKPDIVAPGSMMQLPIGTNNTAVSGDSYSNGIWFPPAGPNVPFFDSSTTGVPGVRDPGEPSLDTRAIVPGAIPNFIRDATNILDMNGNGIIRPTFGTSFAAPHVAGTAALLVERSQEAGLNHDHLTIKSVILNSASKHVRDPQNGNRTWPQFRGESTFYTDPLDNAMGVGQLNGLAAVRQLQRVGQSGLGLTVEKSTIARGEARDEPLNSGKALHAGALVTATLTWDREVTLKPGRPGTDQGDYEVRPLPNLNLLLVNGTTGAEVAGSISAVDNVEHIYFNVPTTDKYNLRIANRSTDQDPTFALAYSAASAEGLSFSVDGGVFNTRPGIPGTQPLPRRGTGISPAPNPAEGLMDPFGNNPYPNDVNALGIAGPGNFPTEGEIFVANCNAIRSLTPTCDGRNMQRLSGALGTRSRVGPHNGPPAAMAVLNQGVPGLPAADQRGVLGLQPNDNVVGLSWGTDGTLGQPSVLLFSVDPDTQGERGDVVFQARVSPMGGAPSNPLPDNPGGGNQFLGQEAAGDIFKSQKFDHFSRTYDSPLLLPAPPRSNLLFIDEEHLGLQAPKGRGSLLGGEEDNLDALEMDSVFVSHPGRQAIDPDGDGLHNEAIFFLLDRWSPSLSNLLGRTPDDIFVSLAPFTNGRFADGETDVGLRRGDALDALVLSDTFPFGLFNNNGDEALFSLDRFSPSVVDGSACSSEVYYTDFNREFKPRIDWKAGGSLFATAEALGLMCTVDDLDALDIRRVFVVPEPSMFAIVVIGLGALVPFLRRRKYEIARSLGRRAFLSR